MEKFDRMDSLFEGFGTRVAINDLTSKSGHMEDNVNRVKGAILKKINSEFGIGDMDNKEIAKELGDVFFNIDTLEVEPDGDPMEYIAKSLKTTPEILAGLIAKVLKELPNGVLESELEDFEVKEPADVDVPDKENRKFLSVGKKYTDKKGFKSRLNKAIDNLEWEELVPGKKIAFSPGMGIKHTIQELKIPGVDRYAISHELAPYGFYAIQGNYKAGEVKRIILYVMDSGDEITPLAVDELKS